MTIDIGSLIAEARKWGPESMSSRLIARLADALESVAAERDIALAVREVEATFNQAAQEEIVHVEAERDAALAENESLRRFDWLKRNRGVEAERDALRAIIDEALAEEERCTETETRMWRILSSATTTEKGATT